ncbi:TIGR04076 family protein [bacterium]|nr:TIGR04076 family protein [bacterium]
MNKVKITVVKRLDFNEIHSGSNLPCSTDLAPVCEVFSEGQEFVTDMTTVPEGFCTFAFVDLARYMSGLRAGADYHWMNEKGKVLACCTDGFRPVVFCLERIEE